jgi:hypothetical protein
MVSMCRIASKDKSLLVLLFRVGVEPDPQHLSPLNQNPYTRRLYAVRNLTVVEAAYLIC